MSKLTNFVAQRGTRLPTDSSGAFLADGGEDLTLIIHITPFVQQKIHDGPVLIQTRVRDDLVSVSGDKDFVYTLNEGTSVLIPVAEFVELEGTVQIDHKSAENLRGRVLIVNRTHCLLWRGDKICLEKLIDTCTMTVE